MKNIFKFLFTALLALFVISCEKDEERAVLNFSANPALTANASTFVLVKADANKDAVTFSLVNPNYGPNLAVTNQLQFAKKGTNFAAPKNVDLPAGKNSITYNVQDFNAIMLGLGLPVSAASQVEVRLKSLITTSIAPVYSNVLTHTVTPYPLVSYMYSPGAYQGWNPATSEVLLSATSNGIYIGYINFPEANSEFKVTADKNWDLNYGTNDGLGLVQNGPNMKSPAAGYHKLTVNMNTMTYTLAAHVWGVIGSATPNSWNTPDTSMTWNSTTQMWETTMALTVGEIKFRLNNDWGTNYGDDGANGTLEAGGANIAVSVAGNYKVTLDLVNLKYTLTKL